MPEITLAEARRCVRCAACLPHCPTYAVARDEAESPRGRLALMDGWARGILEADDGFWAHLDRCLGCRLCESVCPAEVPYGALLDRLRESERQRGRPAPLLHRLLRRLAAHPRALAVLARALGPARRLGFRAGNRRLPSPLRRLAALVPAPPPRPWRPPAGTVLRTPWAGETALFLGCYARVLRPEPLEAAIRVLHAHGIGVVVPPAQTCCGALARHQGERRSAERLAARNRRAFAGARRVVALDTGCLASLRSSLAGETSPGSSPHEVLELCDFLDRVLPRNLPAPSPSRSPLLLHTPCTHRSVAGGNASVARLLARVGIETRPWGRGAGCCGAAGTYGLLQPEIAADLAARVWDPPPPEGSRILTTNIGCALALGAEAAKRNDAKIISHPVEILDEVLSSPRS